MNDQNLDIIYINVDVNIEGNRFEVPVDIDSDWKPIFAEKSGFISVDKYAQIQHYPRNFALLPEEVTTVSY